MWPDQVLNPGPLTYESGALPTALRGPAVKKVGSKMLLPENSVMKVISWQNKPIFTETILLLIGQSTIPYGRRH